jgi:hypothetical protein
MHDIHVILPSRNIRSVTLKEVAEGYRPLFVLGSRNVLRSTPSGLNIPLMIFQKRVLFNKITEVI